VRLWVPQRGQACVPSGAAGRSTVVGVPAATRRWPQLRQNEMPGRFSVPQRGQRVLSPGSVAGTLCAATAGMTGSVASVGGG
jgi:hypothetical protein